VLFPKLTRNYLGIYFCAVAAVALLARPSAADESSAPVLEKPVHTATVESSRPTSSLAVQPDRITGEYVKEYFTDTGKILVSPANWDGSDWLKAGLVVGATTGLYLADTDIRNIAQRNQGSIGNKFDSVGNALGDPLYTLPPLGLFYLYGHFNEDPKARQTSLLAVESLAISGAFTWTLKEIAQRPRPNSGESSTTWYGPTRNIADYSFPSGHSTVAFSIASVIAEEYGNNPYVPPIAYGLATLTGLSRIYGNNHWTSDVFIGGAIGYFVGKAVVRYHTALGDTPIKILPTVSQQGFGLMAEYRF
jgi:membrane-associated phospholipid phosphatase